MGNFTVNSTIVGAGLLFSFSLYSGADGMVQDTSVETLQKFRQEQIARADDQVVQLVNLNANVSSWYVFRSKNPAGKIRVFNLQNVRAPQVQLRLNQANPQTLEFVSQGRVIDSCANFVSTLQSPASGGAPYSPLCEGRIYVRSRSNGYQPKLEMAVQLLRENFGDMGEKVITAAKDGFFHGRYTEEASTVKSNSDKGAIETKGLRKALLDDKYVGQALENNKLGIRLAGGYSAARLNVGEWYPAAQAPGVAVSLIAAGMVSPEILKSHKERVAPLQNSESSALVYLIAFDMKKYSMGWAHGTHQPGVGWSDRLSDEQIQKFGGGAGPDGVNSFGDLVNPGQVPPSDLAKTVATFSGGFQLKHSHFRYGFYSSVNKSTHYGFIDNGVLMASPNTGLSTIVVYIDGSFTMKTWHDRDNAEIPKIRYLRQNGLPVIEANDQGEGIPGAYVRNLAHGNWSGSAEGDTLTPRGAACLIEKGDEQYFVYGYFSAATPSAIARVFQAYGCKQAIHLDMNSPGQAYLSLVAIVNGRVESQPLMRDMADVNPVKQVPRYLAVPDFRDFFWILKK